MIYEDSDLDNDGVHGSVYFIGAFILAVVTGLSLALWVAYQNSKQVIDSL